MTALKPSAGTGAHDWRLPETRLLANAALAKCGVTLSYGASNSELIADRNALRRTINELRGKAEEALERDDDDAAAGFVKETEALAALVKRCQDQLDNLVFADKKAGIRSGETAEAPVLRGVADIEAHFAARARNHASDVSAGDFLRAVAGFKPRHGDVQGALSEGTDSGGGYAVPARVLQGILAALVPASSLLQAGAGILPLEEGAKSYTRAAVSTIPTAAWRAEAGAIAESEPTFRPVVATPRSLAFRFKVSRELLTDADGLDQALITAMAQSFAKELDRAGLRGSGTAPEPRGILNTSGIQSVTNGANGTAQATIKWSNLLDAVKAITAADAPMPTAAIMAPRTLTGFAGLADSTGQPLRRPDLLEGLKFIASSQIPVNLTVGASSDCSEIYCGDFTKVLFAMREAVTIQRLTELYAESGQIGFVGHVRADVMVEYPAAMAVATGIRA